MMQMLRKVKVPAVYFSYSYFFYFKVKANKFENDSQKEGNAILNFSAFVGAQTLACGVQLATL
jgi:hypothetical protein